MSAKTELMVRLKYLDGALGVPSLVDQGVAMSEHNGIANLLRKGLGIVAFNILEDFIKNKATEALDALSASGIAFNDLTDELQTSSIFEALNALNFKADLVKRNESMADSIALIQNETRKIHSTSTFPYQLSSMTFVSSNSNVSDSEITKMLKAFGFTGGWNMLRDISNTFGGGIPDLNQAYKNASNRRNRAAHAATFNYDFQWLSNFKNEILAIAASLDIALTARCRQVSSTPTGKINSHDISNALNYRFLEPRGRHYRETKTIGGRSYKNWTSLTDAINNLQPRLVRKNEFLIVLNLSRRIEDWHC